MAFCIAIGFFLILNTARHCSADLKQDGEIGELLGVPKEELKFYNLSVIWTPFSPERNVSRVFALTKNGPRWAILSGYPSTDFGKNLLSAVGYNKNQLDFYSKVVPLLKNLLKEAGDDEEQFWIDLLGFKDGVFVFEDVESQKGYWKPDRIKGLNIDESRLALETLAKFHAMSAVLYERNQITKEDFDKSLYEKSRTSGNRRDPPYIDLLVDSFVHSIDTVWGKEWKEASTYVRRRLQNMTLQMDKIHERDEYEFNVLNHGGFMILEMFFKSKPMTMRMKSAMNFFYNSPVLDLHKFFSAGPNLEVVFTSSDNLIETYYAALISNLNKFGYKKQKPNFSSLKSKYYKTINYCLVESISNLQYVLRNPEEEYKLMDSLKESWKKNITIFNPILMYGDKYVNAMKKIVKHEMSIRPL